MPSFFDCISSCKTNTKYVMEQARVALPGIQAFAEVTLGIANAAAIAAGADEKKIAKMNRVFSDLKEALEGAGDAMDLIRNMHFPADFNDFKAQIDTNKDGTYSLEEIAEYSKKFEEAFKKTVKIAKSMRIDSTPIEKCRIFVHEMIASLTEMAALQNKSAPTFVAATV